MYIARTPYAHTPADTPTSVAVRLAEQFIVRLNYLVIAALACPSTDPAERAARALRLEELHTRQARWWGVLQRHTDYGAVAFVYLDAVIRAKIKSEDDARFWRDTAADWTARALDRPTSDCAGAMSNWDELGITDLGRAPRRHNRRPHSRGRPVSAPTRVTPLVVPLAAMAGRDWRQRAACAATDPELFYPVDYRPESLVRPARRVCGRCPVRAACLADVMATEDPARRFGVCGGTTPEERTALFRAGLTIATPTTGGAA